MCERPFDCGHNKNNSKRKYKLQTRDKMKRMFAAPGLVVSPATGHVVRPSSRGVRTTPEQPSDSVDKSTSNRGATKIFNDNGSLTVELTNKLKLRLEDRKHLMPAWPRGRMPVL